MCLSDLKKIFNEIYVIQIGSLQHYTSSHIANPARFGQNIKNKRCFHDNTVHHPQENNQIVDIKREKPIIKTIKVTNHEEVSFILKRKAVPNSGSGQNKNLWLRMFLFMKECDSYRWI